MAPSVGESIPPGDIHAVSVSFPEWQHMVRWGQRDEELISKMKAGYPRFFIPLIVRKLAARIVERTKHCKDGSQALLFPCAIMAKACQRFFASKGQHDEFIVLAVALDGEVQHLDTGVAQPYSVHDAIYAVTYPDHHAATAKAFWQHTGLGISTRCAHFWMDTLSGVGLKSGSEHSTAQVLPHAEADDAKQEIRARLAEHNSCTELNIGPQDVVLYHTGMAAIYHSGRLVQSRAKQSGHPKVVVFGFLYVDMTKVLQIILGLSVKLYGHASDSDLDELEESLRSGTPIDALYLEFPGNPLLQSPDLRRIWALSREFDFLVILDDTVATSINLNLISCCDMACTSLTKMFSGACNVMGGSITLNPQSRNYPMVREALKASYIDTIFPTDALVMLNNSSDFRYRVLTANRNAEHIHSILRRHPQVAEVFYPKQSTSQRYYDEFKREEGGYGYLLSVRFKAPHVAEVFYNALDVAKGPSLGTNFTLCCAYTWLAHPTELDYVRQYGIVEDLFRVSIGIEGIEWLERIFCYALAACS